MGCSISYDTRIPELDGVDPKPNQLFLPPDKMEKPRVGQQVRTEEMRQVLREKQEGFRHSPESIEKIRKSVTEWWRLRKEQQPLVSPEPKPIFRIDRNITVDFK